jgi:Flp pilus assembly protein TadB
MTMLAPPPAPPRIAQGDHDGMDRLRLRLTQVLTTLVTVIVTAWLCTLGAIPAILAVMVAKHILVAVLVMGLDADARYRELCGTADGEPPAPRAPPGWDLH